ncbi:MAG: hypothetical protein V1792_14885 [Pseudomonadota bacterium]
MWKIMTCRCPEESNPDILKKAKELFGNPHPSIYGFPEYEWENGGTGKADTDNDGVREIDCSHLPWEAIKAALPNECRVEIPITVRNVISSPVIDMAPLSTDHLISAKGDRSCYDSFVCLK